MLYKDGMITFYVRFDDYSNDVDSKVGLLRQKVDFLRQDLTDLNNMEQVHFEPLYSDPDREPKVVNGLKFEVAGKNIRRVLLRLQDRLYSEPLDTIITIKLPRVKLRIKTFDYDDLAGIIDAFDRDFLFQPICNYLIDAEKYVRSAGGVSEAESNNLKLLREKIELSFATDFPEEEAERLLKIVTGPWKTPQERKRFFDETVNAEIERLERLVKADWYRVKSDEEIEAAIADSWEVLKALSENLGIRQEQAQNYFNDGVSAFEVAIQAHRQEQKLQQKFQEELAEKRKKVEAEAKKKKEREEQIENYRQAFRAAIADRLYPTAEDQAKLLFLRRLVDDSDQKILKIEEEERSKLYGSIKSDFSVDYSRLRALLYEKQWLAADRETEYLLLSAFSKNMQPLNEQTVQNIPSVDLQTIDQLWSRYSQGTFGFRAQLSVFKAEKTVQPEATGPNARASSPQDIQRRTQLFKYDVEWQRPGNFFSRGIQPYAQLKFTESAPKGHLPTWRWCCSHFGQEYEVKDTLVAAVIAHFRQCFRWSEQNGVVMGHDHSKGSQDHSKSTSPSDKAE